MISSRFLSSSISILLSTLILLLLSVSTTAIPASSPSAPLINLTTTSFPTEVLTSKNSWLVEFYSPYCQHCKAFAPTWANLNQDKQYQHTDYEEGAKFKLGRVDCVAYGDLCVEQGIKRYPTLKIYRDGIQQPKEFRDGKGERDYLGLSTYIDHQAMEFRLEKGLSTDPKPQTPSTDPQTSIQSSEQVTGPELPKIQVGEPEKPASASDFSKDTEVKEALEAAEKIKVGLEKSEAKESPSKVSQTPEKAIEAEKERSSNVKLNLPNPKGEVLKFGQEPIATIESFREFLKKDSPLANGGAVFVKFFAPWCPHCKNMAKAYSDLAGTFKDRINVLEVDCEANQKVCMEFEVKSFPTLKMFNQGIKSEFRGARDFNSMNVWATKAGADSGLKILKDDEELIKANQREEVVFLWLHEGEGEKVGENLQQRAVEEASKALLTTPFHIYRSNSPKLLAQYSSYLPPLASLKSSRSVLLVFKDHFLNSPISFFQAPSHHPSSMLSPTYLNLTSTLTTFVHQNRYPLIAEISGTNFNDVVFNSADAMIGLLSLSEIYHDGQTTSTGIGKKIREIELEEYRNLARSWRDLNGKDSVKMIGGEERRIIWAYIDADRWASALKSYYSLTPEQYPSILLIDGKKMEYFPIPSTSSYLSTLTSTLKLAEAAESTSSIPSGKWLDPTQIFSHLEKIFNGEIAGKSSRSFLDLSFRGASLGVDRIVVSVSRHPIMSFAFLALVIAAFVAYLRKIESARRKRDPWGRGGRSTPPLTGSTKFD